MFKIYNTLDGKKDEFNSIKPKKVGMYVCGPTVYDYDHIGHARTYLTFDLLNRFLRYLGYSVEYIQNITDVGHLVGDTETGLDKVKQKAHETGDSIGDTVRHFTDAHLKDLKSLHILLPDNFPKASEHIGEIIDYIKVLIDKGFAYATEEGNVYFSVNKKPDYGKLSGRGLAEVLTGTRVESAKDKRVSADFALWRAAPAGATEFVWESPWPVRETQGEGKGYPGWHIECSVMSQKYLGDTFDIHGSAMEHIFPHHENEIAQAEAKTGQPLAHYWVHSGMLTTGGQKMSKSSRNTISVPEALKSYSSNEIRLAFYQTQYRQPFDYTKEAMGQGVALRAKLFGSYTNLTERSDETLFNEIISALSDDLDSPRALSLWAEHKDKINKADTDKLFSIFGLEYRDISTDENGKKLADERAEARAKKDFLTSDNRRGEIEQLGYEVIDTDSGPVYLPR